MTTRDELPPAVDAPSSNVGATTSPAPPPSLLLFPPVDPLENGLMALIAPSEESGTAIDGNRTKLQGSVLAAIVAWVEVIAFLGETFFAMILSVVCRSALHALATVVLSSNPSLPPSKPNVWESLWDATFVCLYVLRRSAANFHQPSLQAWIQRLGLWPPISMSSSVALALIAYQVVGFAVVVSWQYWTNNWVFTWSNYSTLQHVLEILLFSPIKEELVFRGVAFHLVVNRLPMYPKQAVGVVSVLFGSTHLLNVRHANFSALYVAMQLCFGIEIGYFYGLQYIQTRSLGQLVVLHIVNNVLSSFTSTQMEDLLASPLLLVLFVHSVVVYGVLIRYTLGQLHHFDRTKSS
ncbi:hypothetical protein H257_14771 [Aphanomyces astaci]|uniref:CAAX prenyl protease 2/Lysostaphin resistance protein A-like domain-containing protein n=1 Tax=Aphanomyces astaci TaxID=112090 RepID=W4FPZ7_APHAT|nr:hypothetical protein H257_14771 [Aphanomyces astaci]ETV69535.1 hypothetical protein H257_14771 [Aphanomyces astaci]|eukprot:XP_009840959.1 hypothetical protein H257_14771 [Aphanomyces astaci]